MAHCAFCAVTPSSVATVAASTTGWLPWLVPYVDVADIMKDDLDITLGEPVSRTIIDIDDSALEAAMRELGTKTKVATVNMALTDVAERPRRLAFLDNLASADDDLGDPAVMEKAWR